MEPGRVSMKFCTFSFSNEALRLLSTMVLAAGKMSLFSLGLLVSRKSEPLISP